MTEHEITNLLADKHSQDIFVPQCKTGSTWFSNVRKMDAWAIQKSWDKPYSTAYEIKISRQDFTNDSKWMEYLPYCNSFYFVCPHGVIDKAETPEQAGLMLVSKTGTKLFTKKKAPFRQVGIPVEVLLYILMWRTKLIDDMSGVSPRELAKAWLETEQEDKDLGSWVGKKLYEQYQSQVVKVRDENSRLRSQISNLEDIKKFCEDLKIYPSALSWTSESRLEQEFKKKLLGCDIVEISDKLNRAAASVQEIVDNALCKSKEV
jgi:hypothetical protein